jgi:hypothetical protein
MAWQLRALSPGVKQPTCETGHIPPSNAEQGSTCTFLNYFMVFTGSNYLVVFTGTNYFMVFTGTNYFLLKTAAPNKLAQAVTLLTSIREFRSR